MKRRELMLSSLALAAGPSRGQPASSPASSPPSAQPARRRRDVTSPSAATDLAKYRNAVAQLVSLPSSDKRSWANLAQQHNSFCPHTNWWFLPWHRAYLFYFERVCQDVLGDKTFSLPYWDWTKNPRIPGPFWSGVLAGNGMTPVVTREIVPNEDLDSELVGRAVIDSFMRNSQAQSAYSSAPSSTINVNQRSSGTSGFLEGTPHNSVHRLIAGTMVTLMSPLDPVFWLHHANIDRLWLSWHSIYNTAPSDKLWRDWQLGDFWDPQSKAVVKELASKTLTISAYGYDYDRLETKPSGPSALNFADTSVRLASLKLPELLRAQTALLSSSLGTSLKINTATTAMLKTNDAFDAVVSSNATWAVAPTPTRVTPVNLVLEGVKVPTGARTFLRVFLNCEKPSLRTPTDDPSYVGSVSTFAGDHDHGAEDKGESFSLDATETLSRLVARSSYKPGVVDVSLVAVGPGAKSGAAVVRPGRAVLVPIGT